MSDGRLALLKTLGDNTRYAIYLELARASSPRTTAEVAEMLELHPNTVRPHLERMRDVGLLVVETESRGEVGRPQHRWSLAPDAPSLGLEPPATPLLASMLAGVATVAGATPEDAREVGEHQGRAAATERAPLAGDCLGALVAELDRLGFDPAVAADEESATVAFTRCPFAAFASANPQLVCSLHRGMVEGFVDAVGGGEVTRFGTLVDRRPCEVSLATH
jgi:predicted ArsR family transcriptional regulator